VSYKIHRVTDRKLSLNAIFLVENTSCCVLSLGDAFQFLRNYSPRK